MRGHLPALDHGGMDPAPVPYLIRIDGHLGATMLSAFPALAPRHHGAHTVLTGLLDRSARQRNITSRQAPAGGRHLPAPSSCGQGCTAPLTVTPRSKRNDCMI